MKEKITYLILGILIGAVITAGCFLVFSKNKAPGGNMDKQRPDFSNMTDEEREEMMKNREEGGEFKKPNDMNEIDIPQIDGNVIDNSLTE